MVCLSAGREEEERIKMMKSRVSYFERFFSRFFPFPFPFFSEFERGDIRVLRRELELGLGF